MRTLGESGLLMPTAFVIHLATAPVSESAGWLRRSRGCATGVSRSPAGLVRGWCAVELWWCSRAGEGGAGSWSVGLVESAGGREQQDGVWRVFMSVDVEDVGAGTAVDLPGTAGPGLDAGGGAEAAVAALYRAHAMSLIRLAYVMLDDLPGAEDVVQEAFCGLYRRWDRLKDAGNAMFYVRAAVLNGCRSALRRRAVRRRVLPDQAPAVSAEAAVLSAEEREEVIRAVGRLPHRQREALVLRFYLDLPDDQIARVMGIRPGTVRSATCRALDALGRALKETP
jgi:RNA polymerase sigma-70 factor (sigma-E family)